jgi:hypothetical protein
MEVNEGGLPKWWEKASFGRMCSSFRDRFDILLKKSPSGVVELRRMMVYGKSQLKGNEDDETHHCNFRSHPDDQPPRGDGLAQERWLLW